jgi:hypothetical protein
VKVTVPDEYAACIKLYRFVSDAEHSAWAASGRLEPQQGGMDFGKHFTSSEAYAREWGRNFIKRRWDRGPARVLRALVALDHLDSLHFDEMADGIGPKCFVPFEALNDAEVQEVQ